MVISPDLLREIYAQLQNSFAGHPFINIHPSKGDPPEQYDIVYRLNAYHKDKQNNIYKGAEQRILVTIPIGFPHFPPSCKPKSPIFHPDFDPAAICIGDFWHPQRSLAELIIYLGRLLNGESYSKENTFNEEAALWYLAHANNFPLQDIKWQSNDLPASPSPPSDTSVAVDTLEDADLQDGFDFTAFPDNLDELNGSDDDTALAHENKIDLSHLYLLERQHNFFQLKKSIELLERQDEDTAELLQTATDNIRQAKKLHKEAKKLEQDGDATGALRSYTDIEFQVADFPGISNDTRRVRQTLEKLSGEVVAEVEISTEPEAARRDVPPARSQDTVNSSKRKSKGIHFFKNPKAGLSRGKPIGKNLIGLFIFGFLLFGAIGYYKWHASRALQLIKDSLYNCEAAIAQGSFAEADQLCREVTKISQPSFLLNSNNLAALQDKANAILQSESMRQGLQGKTLYQGRYLASSDVKLLQQFDEHATTAAKMFAAEQWRQAIDAYGRLQEMAKTSRLFSEQQQKEIAQKLSAAQFRMYVQEGQTALGKRQYHEAQQAFEHAQQMLPALAGDDRDKFGVAIAQGLMAVQFETHKTDAEKFFSQADWHNAIDSYKQALTTARQSSTESAALAEIELKKNRALLYTTIEHGNNAFSNGNWNEAAASFRQAMKILQKNSDILTPTDLQNSINKLAKLTLQTLILQFREQARVHIENSNLSAAKKTYEQAIDAINKSNFTDKQEFIADKEEFAGNIRELERDIYRRDKQDYLMHNYQKIFLTNYPTAEKENLSNPVVTLHKDTPDHLIYRMQCTEHNTGSRPSALVMFYSLNKKNGQWQLYTEP
jgi:ubiquitin-protein ligase